MFTLAHNGNILLNINKENPAPPSAAALIEAFERSPFSNCKLNHDSINDFYNKGQQGPTLVVAAKVDAEFSVELSDDSMIATAKLTTAYGGKAIDLDQAKKTIIKAGVTRGYHQALLENLLKKQFELPGGASASGVVAKGRLPVDGQPSEFLKQVPTLRDRIQKPQLKEDGTVDMRDFGKLASVKPGTVLLIQKPATPGKPGFTVKGDELPAKPGASETLIAGEGTEISKNDPHQLIATISGVPVEIACGMRVDDIFTIAEVNVKSGHIDFDGSVIITQGVGPGMKVNAKGDINVLGTVESAHLTATGNITIKQGAIGHQAQPNDETSLSCRICCDGDIQVSHTQYTYLEGNNITIERQASHCRMKAVNQILVGQEDNPKGKLYGGEILDARTVIAGEIGSDSGAKMIIHLAASGTDLTAENERCTQELAKVDEQLRSLQTALEKADALPDPAKKRQLIEKIGATQLHFIQQADDLENRVASLGTSLEALLENASITAAQKLNSGVQIYIYDKVLRTTRHYPPCHVQLQEGKVEIEFKTS